MKANAIRIALAVALLSVGLLGASDLEAQCAMCRKALNGAEADSLIAALRNGIVFLLVVPLATFGTIAWYAVRGQQRQAASGETGHKSAER